MRITISLIFCFLLIQSINAQTDSLTYSIELDSIAITASAGIGRTQHRIDANKLNQNPVQNISSAINEVPGVYMHTGTLNTNRITVRGIGNRSLFSTTKLRSYIDDIPLTNGVGETTIEDFDREILHSVDLYKGPGATAYGSGLGGLMLLKTNNLPDDNYVKSQIAIGQFGFMKTNQTVSLSKNKFRLKLLQGYNHSDGYRDNNSYDNRNYSLLGGYNHGDHQFSFLLHHININAQIPSSLNSEDFAENPEKAAFTWGRVNGYEDYTKTIVGLTYSTIALDNWHLKSTVFSNFYKGYESRPFNILDDESTNFGLRFSMNYDFQNKCESKFLFGLEWSKELYDWDLFRTDNGMLGEQFEQNQEDRNSTQIFAQYSLNPIQNLKVEIGLNANLTNYTLEDLFDADTTDISGTYKYDWIASPRINLKYSINRSKYVYALISHGYSIPTLEETLTPDGLINTDIKPEIGMNYEIGYRTYNPTNKLNYGISIYHMKVKDLLVARRTSSDQFIGINAGGSRHIGFEFDAKYNIYQSENWKTNFDISYTFQRFRFTDFVDDDKDYSGNELTGAIPHLLSIVWSSHYKSTGISFNFKYVDSMPMRDDNSVYSESYSLLDFFIYQNIKLGNFDIVTNVGVNNVLDAKYASMILINAGSFGGNAPRYFYPGLPLNAFVQTSIKYKF